MINTLNNHLVLFAFLLLLIFSFECSLISEPLLQKTSPQFPLTITLPKTALNLQDFPTLSPSQLGKLNLTTAPSLPDFSHWKTDKLHGQEVVKITDLPPDLPIPEKRYLLHGKTVVRLTDLR
jgi:hypothetical protein